MSGNTVKETRTSGGSVTVALPEWQPIETAPRDGSEIIVYRPLARETGDPLIAIAATTSRPRISPQGVEHYTNRWCHPTHWMPLPLPPSRSGRVGL